MMSHDLAKLLLANENLPVATHADNHSSFGLVRVGVASYAFYPDTEYVIIGNFSRKRINYPNEYVVKMLHGDVPEDWR